MNLKPIRYLRHEYLHDPESVSGDLLTFVYDVPYLGACGIFPPLHILNELLGSGGNIGGMSPGATWKPFMISEQECATLVELVKKTPVADIKPNARYALIPFEFDSKFDHIENRLSWLQAVCQKHRDDHHRKLKESGFLR